MSTKTFLKLAWTLASIFCFILPLLVIPFDDWHGLVGRVGPDMSFGMLILTFPMGVLYLVAALIVYDVFFTSQLPVSALVLLWFGFFVTGYVQWFYLLPLLLDKHSSLRSRSITTLGLEKGSERNTKRKKHSHKRVRKARTAVAQMDSRQVLQFDEIRRTPLERVISEADQFKGAS